MLSISAETRFDAAYKSIMQCSLAALMCMATGLTQISRAIT